MVKNFTRLTYAIIDFSKIYPKRFNLMKTFVFL